MTNRAAGRGVLELDIICLTTASMSLLQNEIMEGLVVEELEADEQLATTAAKSIADEDL